LSKFASPKKENPIIVKLKINFQMKKCLLLVLIAGSFAAYAQNRIATNVTRFGPVTHNSGIKVMDPSVVKPATIPAASVPAKHQSAAKRSGHGNGNSTTAICESAIGSAGNQFGTAFGQKTNLWYNRDLNMIAFIHRANPPSATSPYTTGFIEYDYSTNGGATWTINQQFLYRDTTWDGVSFQDQRARYPQGGIYNPTGNTDPANAYVTGYGPVTDNAAVINGGWPWHWEGTSGTGSSTNNQQLYNIDQASGGLGAIIPQGGTIVKNTGETWWSCEGYDGAAYDDTIILSHGIYNGAGDFDYTFVKIPVPVCIDNSGAKLFSNAAVIFNDAGDKGYVVVLGNNWVCNTNPADSTMGMIIFKTTDGGNTWNEIARPDHNLVDQMLLNGGYAYMTSTQLDLAMDRDDGLHIALPVVPFQPGNTIYLGYEYASWGMFDFSTTDDLSWNICLITKPQTYYGDFGTAGSTTDPQIQDENRLQISRNWEGSKIFYTWFDTDTAIFGAGLNNFPDCRSVGMDLDGGLWTAEVGHTEFSGTSADGSALFGNVCYYTINDGANENIPFVINTMQAVTGTGQPVNFFYEGCAAMSNYVNPGNCVIIDAINGPANASGTFSVSSNYPNPYSGKTSIDVTLAASADVTIEISNAVGQLLNATPYKNLRAGVNTITIDGSALSKGLYFYTVKAGNESVTKTMSVE
jgi:hypothetical protein